jgi:inner membrane protein
VPTIFTHPAIPLAVRAVAGGASIPRRLLVAAAIASVLPDLDAIGHLAGVPYASTFGHRGFTHSLTFALLAGLAVVPLAGRLRAGRGWAFGLVFVSCASHGLLDALTDDGLGVAFLSPFSDERYFLPWRPIPAAPIGLTRVFSASELHVFGAELLFVWLPCLFVVLAARAAMAFRSWRAAVVGSAFTAAFLFAGSGVSRPDRPEEMLATAIANLEKQAAVLATHADPACPDDYAALQSGRTLRVSLFYGYDEHEGVVHDRANAAAMAHVLTGPCRGGLSACGFRRSSASRSATRLEREIDGRNVEVNLFTSSLPRNGVRTRGADLDPERASRAVMERFLRELVESDVVFYMGHSRRGGSIGFEPQSGLTTAVNSVQRRRMRPVIEALEHRPTRLRILAMFSCDSNRYFRRAFQSANPALSLILTTGDIRYGPAEQASLGALEAILSKNCGSAVRASLTPVDEPDPEISRLVRGQ